MHILCIKFILIKQKRDLSMLIEFNVTNYRSIKETQTLSMAANNTKGLENNYFNSGVRGIPKLLVSTAMYGPNAAGKSNFILAVNFMKKFVLSSSQDHQRGDSIDVTPFKFDKETCNNPSEFEVTFIKNNVRYQYGFAVTSKKVTDEWLFAFPEGKSQRWFERHYNEDEKAEEWYLGPKLRGNRKTWKSATRENALFLSTATQLNSSQLKNVFEWFQEGLHVFGTNWASNGFTITQCQNKTMKENILNFMNAADFSISDIQLKKQKFSQESLPDDMPEDLQRQILEDLKGKELVNVKLMHPSTSGAEQISIDLEDESTGTQKFFSFAGPLLDILNDGLTLFVDELNSSMHPLMVRFLVNLFHDPVKNKNNAQLVFTTHDTSILDNEVLRRDQIWFFEKNNEDNSTHLYPLTDFKPRINEALGKNYLQGRYGALPFFGGFNL